MNAKSEQHVAQASRSFADWGMLALSRLGKTSIAWEGDRAGPEAEFLEGLVVIKLGEIRQARWRSSSAARRWILAA